MDETTTTDGGASSASQAQPQEPAVTIGQPVPQGQPDQVISKDDSGNPVMTPVASTEEPTAPTEAVEPTKVEPTQAEDISEWAKKKGLPMDDPVKLATMYRNAEKKIGEATAKARELEQTAITQSPVDYTGNPQVDDLSKAVNTLLIQNNVRDFWLANPEAREFESKMAEIVTARPHLQNDLDALYALARTDPTREAEIKSAGGREALTNLAQKQSAIPPGSNATNSGVFESNQITPSNVAELVDKHDQAWFEKNHDAISKAMSG